MIKKLLPSVLLLGLSYGCSEPFKLEKIDFSWPVESELAMDDSGFVQDARYSYKICLKPLLFAELQDSSITKGKSFRIIMDSKGYYYVTSQGFRHVYLFCLQDGALQQKNRIQISETPIDSPAFNSRPPYIELLYSNKSVLLNQEGIKGDKK